MTYRMIMTIACAVSVIRRLHSTVYRVQNRRRHCPRTPSRFRCGDMVCASHTRRRLPHAAFFSLTIIASHTRRRVPHAAFFSLVIIASHTRRRLPHAAFFSLASRLSEGCLNASFASSENMYVTSLPSKISIAPWTCGYQGWASAAL
jgi:hypothetical protein